MAEEAGGGVVYSVDVDLGQLDKLDSKINQVENSAKQSFGAVDRSLKSADSSMMKMNKTSESVSNAFKLQKNAAQQLSFQLQDVVVQAQMGTSWFTIIGQQAPQILGIAGAAGAALGVFAALAAAIGGVAYKMLSASDDALTLENAVKRLGDAVMITDDGVALLTQEITRLAAVSQDAAMAQLAQEVIDAKNVINTASKEVKSAYGDLTSGLNLSVITTQIDRYKAAIEEGGEAARIAVKGISQRPDIETKESYAALEQSIRSISAQFKITREDAFEFIQAISSAAKGGDPKAIQDLQNFISGLSKETKFTNENLAKFQNQLSEAFGEARNAGEIMKTAQGFLDNFDEALNGSTEQAKKSKDAIASLVDSVKMQAFTYGMSQKGIALYSAELLGADDVTKQIIKSYFDAIEAAEIDIESKKQQAEESRRLGDQVDSLVEKLKQQNFELSDPSGSFELYIKNQRSAAVAAGRNADEVERLIRANARLKDKQKADRESAKQAEKDLLNELGAEQDQRKTVTTEFQQVQGSLIQQTETPAQKAMRENEERLAVIRQYQALENADKEAALEAQFASEQLYAEQIKTLRENQKSSFTNMLETLGFSYQQLGNQAAGSLAMVATGAMTGKEAIAALANSILTQAIGALIQLGIQAAIGQAAVTAGAVASGLTIATAMAPAAAMTSLATAGANSVPASAGILSTVGTAQVAALGGGRLYGGPVGGGKLYPFMEDGKPEALQMGGKTYLWTGGGNGNVVSNKDMASGGMSGGVNISVVVENYGNEKVSVSRDQSKGVTGEEVIKIIVGNINERGQVHSAIMRSTTAGNRT